jgi:hypothetical protein
VTKWRVVMTVMHDGDDRGTAENIPQYTLSTKVNNRHETNKNATVFLIFFYIEILDNPELDYN